MSKHEDRKNPADISELQDNFSKQQKKISILKELVRKSDSAHSVATSSAQEKVKSIAVRLTNLKSKAIKGQKNVEKSEDVNASAILSSNENVSSNIYDQFNQAETSLKSPIPPINTSTPNKVANQNLENADSSTPSNKNVSAGSEKILLLRKQMEQNKALIARRASSKQHLEQLVTQLKEKFDTTQQSLDTTSEIGKSLTELSVISSHIPITHDRYKSATDISAKHGFSLERERIKFLENRCRILEKQLDTFKQNSSHDKTAAIDVNKTEQALKENIEHLEKTIQHLNEELAENRRYENNCNDIITLKKENDEICQQLEQHVNRISELEDINKDLETVRFDLTAKIDELGGTINELNRSVETLQQECIASKLELKDTKSKLEVLQDQQINIPITQDNASTGIDSQIKAEMAKQIQELNDELELLRSDYQELKEKSNSNANINSGDNEVLKLNDIIEKQRETMQNQLEIITKQEEDLMEKTIELNVLNVNFKVLEEKLEAISKNKPLFSSNLGDNTNLLQLENEIQQLKSKLDESNKAMIKMKLKLKQTEKQMETLKKGSDLHAEIVNLNKKIDEQQQKIIELEDEKGQWQLSQVEDNNAEKSDEIKEDYKNLKQKYISVTNLNEELEEIKQKQEAELASLKEQMNVLKQEIQDETARVKSELSEVKLEEELEKVKKALEKLKAENNEKQMELNKCNYDLDAMKMHNIDIDQKLQKYVKENIDLLDKLEKLTKSSSSAESIEIVERLTQQEQAEINEYNKKHDNSVISINELTQTDISPELNDSLVKLRDESAELMNKIELFTTERREVLEKMEVITNENANLLQKIQQITEEKNLLESNLILAQNDKAKIEKHLIELKKEKEQLSNQLSETTANKSNLSQELSSMHKSTEIVPSIDPVEGATLFDKCEKSLCKLNSELEAYRKANDKNSKFNVSKKLAKEAKNAHTQLSELLQKVRESSTAVETVTVVETVVAVTAANGEALAEYEQLTEKNRTLQNTVDDLRRQLEEIERSIQERHENIDVFLTEEIERKSVTENVSEPVINYELQCTQLQSLVENLKRDLNNEVLANNEKTQNIEQLTNQLNSLRETSKEFDAMSKNKDINYEKQIQDMARLTKELEAKCETYQAELKILQTLADEHKNQLIDALRHHENEINIKLLDIQQKDELIAELHKDLAERNETIQRFGDNNLECTKLRMALETNKNLVADQLLEIANKQDTIDELNRQLIEIYKNVEESNNKYLEKADEVAYLQELLEANNKEIERCHKENDEQKHVVDKLLSELHSHKTSSERLPQLETEFKNLQQSNKQLEQLKESLEQRNREQMEKLKKYAISLKKRNGQYQELERRMQEVEKATVDTLETEKLQKQFEQDKDEIKMKFEAKLNELQTALEIKTVEHLKALEHINSIEIQLNHHRSSMEQNDEWKQKVIEYENQISTYCAEISNLQCQLADENKSKVDQINLIKQQNDQLNAIEMNFNQIQNELSQLRGVKSELEQSILEKEKEISQLQKQVNDLIKKDEQKTEDDQRIDLLNAELKAKSLKFEKSKAIIKDRNNQIQRLQLQLTELQAQLSKQSVQISQIEIQEMKPEEVTPNPHSFTKEEYDMLQKKFDELQEIYIKEKSSFEATISRLNTLHDGIQAKLQEDMSYIETIEQENALFKERIYKLEECVASFEERRASMERRVNLMDEQMHERENQFEKTEDELVYRLNALSEHDEVIAQRLFEAENEKETLHERTKMLQEELNNVQSKHLQLQIDYQNFKTQTESNHDEEIMKLKEIIKNSECEMQKTRCTYDAQLAAKTTELDELECETTEQFEKMNAEYKALSKELEQSKENNVSQMDEIVRLRENITDLEQLKNELEREATWLRMQQDNAQQDQYDLQDLRMQTMQDKTEIENLKQQIETLVANHEIELHSLRTQICELDALRMQVGQNQTDDQVFIETENKRLADALTEKEAIIENYRLKNLQLESLLGNSPIQPVSNESILATSSAINVSQEPQLLATDTNDVVMAPTMFFSSAQTDFSPFDEIVPVRMEDTARAPQSEMKQTTIEDLQRNVSDLEKHAQDLETKLVHTIQQNTELQATHGELERRNIQLTQQMELMKNEITANQEKLMDIQNLNKLLENELSHFENERRVESDVKSAELNNRLEQLQQLLYDREMELSKVKSELCTVNKARNDEIHLKQSQQKLESQILSSESSIQLAPSNLQTEPSLSMFFGVSPSDVEFENISKLQTSDNVAIEENIVPKQAYECGVKDTPVDIISTLNLDDEWNSGWEFNSTNVLPTSSMGQLGIAANSVNEVPSLISREQQLEIQIKECNEKIQDLQNSLVQTEKQNKELQLKSSKLMKKLKEFKQKNDELQISITTQNFRKSNSVESNTMVDDLDAAIQDELKSQIALLEAKSQEYQKLYDEQLQENMKLVKRIDILSANNGRHDIEVQMYQSRIRELQQNINSLNDWDTDNSNTVNPNNQKNSTEPTKVEAVVTDQSSNQQEDFEKCILELKAEIKDLSGEVQELQALLDEEKSNAAIAQDRIQLLQDELAKQSVDAITQQSIENQNYNELKVTFNNLEDKYNDVFDKYEKLKYTYSVTQRNENRLTAENLEIKQSLAKFEDECNVGMEKINQMNAEITKLQKENEALQEQVKTAGITMEVPELNDKLLQSEHRINTLNNNILQLQKQNDELQKINEKLQYTISIQVPSDKDTTTETGSIMEAIQVPHENETNDYKIQLTHYNERVKELEQLNDELHKKISNLNDVQQKISEYEIEIRGLQKEIEILKDSQSSESCDNDFIVQLQEKDSEIMHLKQRIEDLMREDQTEKLVIEILTKNQEIHMLKLQVKNLEDDKQELEHNLSLQASRGIPENFTDLELQNSELQKKLDELQLNIKEIETEKLNMETELQVLNNHILSNLDAENKVKDIVLQLDAKNIEIEELRKSIDLVKATAASADVHAINSQWESILDQKCGEITKMWQEHVNEREKQFKEHEQRLQNEILTLRANYERFATTAISTNEPSIDTQELDTNCLSKLPETRTSSSTPASEVTASSSSNISTAVSKDTTPLHRAHKAGDTSDNPEEIIERMHAVLESQEIEIVTLKEQLAIRSAEYARLAAQYDPFKLQTTLSHSGMSSISAQDSPQMKMQNSSAGNNESSLVSKSELDFALYMWHQRDMRCEELTLELVSLLEERDTLQLKLSNTIRQVEEMKSKSKEFETSTNTNSSTPSSTSISSMSPQKSNVTDGSRVVERNAELNQKLSQLQTVDHSKDKIIQEDREHHIRQMKKIQQDVAKIPPAAISELVGTNLSQTGQSPSSVLLNWLWGNKPSSND